MNDDEPDEEEQREVAHLRVEIARLKEALHASTAEIQALTAARERPLDGQGADAIPPASDTRPDPLAELRHRVRNILAVTRLVFTRTVDSEADPEEIRSHFLGRFDAIARISANVLRTATGETDLEDLIRDELLTVGVTDGPDLLLDGPEVSLSAEAAEGLGLALHELTTNALKFGALRFDGSKLEITWSTDVRYGLLPKLNLTWTEKGVPAVSVEPGHRGFGSELILEALPYRLGAETKLELLGGGIRCSIAMPLAGGAAASRTIWR